MRRGASARKIALTHMKLVIIYGPEASGKLTVAKALASATGFRLAHNHLSADLATSLFDFGTPEHAELVWAARMLVFEAAAKAKLPGLIFTWAFSYPDFLPYLDRVRATLAPYTTEIQYVYLTCDEAERRRRVLNSDRGKHGKIQSVGMLERQNARKNYVMIPGTDSLVTGLPLKKVM